MQIQINSGDLPTTEAISQHIHDKVEHELRLFNGQVTRVEVHLHDHNGPKGGDDKQCMLEARLAGHPPLAVEHHAIDMYLAIDGAAGKLHRAIQHRIDRHKGHLTNH